MPFELIYRKAPHTARWQSGKKIRMQNLDRNDFHGFNLRNVYIPRVGYRFAIADLSQIEPRVLAWLAKDTVFLAACAEGQSPYEAHARSTMDYKESIPLKKFDPSLYQMAKARTLALGYQAGPERFIEMAKTMAGLTVEPDEARTAVADFRAKAKKITSLWYNKEAEMRRHVDGNYFVRMPNGTMLRYFNLRASGDHYGKPRVMASVIRNSRIKIYQTDLYGGKLVENLVQRIARDVLAEMIAVICLYYPDLHFLWSVHDEIICEVEESKAEEQLKNLELVMSTPPQWAPDLPVACEGGLFDKYIK